MFRICVGIRLSVRHCCFFASIFGASPAFPASCCLLELYLPSFVPLHHRYIWLVMSSASASASCSRRDSFSQLPVVYLSCTCTAFIPLHHRYIWLVMSSASASASCSRRDSFMRSHSMLVASLSSASAYIITAFPVYDMASGSTAVLPLLVLVGRVHTFFLR